MIRSFGRPLAAFALFLCFAAAASAQIISAGTLPGNPNFGFNPTPVAITAIDLSAPATGTGTMTSAAFIWSLAPCTATVKIKFFRRSGDILTFLAERGPFNVTANAQNVALSPAVSVEAGDLIGIARVAACGSPVGQSPGASAGLVAYGADITTNVSIASGTLAANSTLAVLATGTGTITPGAETLVGVLPVAIMAPGLAGSNFRTAVQLYNPSASGIAGRLVFHPQGVSGNSTDPSLFFAIGPGEMQFYPDLLAAMGQTGIGSVDVLVTSGTIGPVASVRVFNDAGAAGTSGFTEDVLKPSEALSVGMRGALLGPFDTSLFRFNVGVRTLSGGASIQVTVRDAAGAVLRTFSRTYPPNFFQQADAATFLGAALGANQSITIDVISGSLFIYGTTADNRTNDPAIAVAKSAL